MKKSLLPCLIAILLQSVCGAQITDPAITSWILSASQTGYNGISANVQSVNYTNSDVYVTCTCIPGYDVGPWTANPNTPANQNFCFKIARTPEENTGTKTKTPLGHVGVWTNGVSVFNALDAQSYNNQNVWFRNAYFFEGVSFDNCLGHPAPNGEYHHHVNPVCLYDQLTTTVHSPIVGYAFDGFPIYGAYGYTNTDGTGAIKRMTPSYRTRNIANRTTLPNGTAASSAGPAVNTQYPLGAFIEDFEHVQGLGDLDEHNGRFAITPDYPNGTYAYYVTIDEDANPIYPYSLGATYYGTLPSGNTGPQSGHNTVPANATHFTGNTPSTITTIFSEKIVVYPNPTNGQFEIKFDQPTQNTQLFIYNTSGTLIFQQADIANVQTIDLSTFANGLYLLRLVDENKQINSQKISKQTSN
jgi:hypothetical protein